MTEAIEMPDETICFLNRIIEKEDEAEKETADDSQPKLDLKFKEGQTIKVNLNIAVSHRPTFNQS